MSVMFLGTCRAYDVARLLARRGVAVSVPGSHRFATPRQLLQFAQHVQGAPYWYRPGNLHLLSNEALDEAIAGRSDTTQRMLLDACTKWDEHSAFVVELSSVKEHMLNGQGDAFACGMTVHQRWDEVAALRPAEKPEAAPASEWLASSILTEFRRMLGGRPVVWLDYAIPDAPAQHVVDIHARVAAVLRRTASRFGDAIIDADAIRKQMGQDAFFRKWTESQVHYSAQALKRLADAILPHLTARSKLATPLATAPHLTQG